MEGDSLQNVPAQISLLNLPPRTVSHSPPPPPPPRPHSGPKSCRAVQRQTQHRPPPQPLRPGWTGRRCAGAADRWRPCMISHMKSSAIRKVRTLLPVGHV